MRKLVLIAASLMTMSANGFAGESKVIMSEILMPSGDKSSCIQTKLEVTEQKFIATVGFVTIRTATLTDVGAPHCRFFRAPDENKRSYDVSGPKVEQSCNSTQYTSLGKGQKLTPNPAVASYDALVIQDNRTRTCEDYRPLVQVQETVRNAKGLKVVRHLSTMFNR